MTTVAHKNKQTPKARGRKPSTGTKTTLSLVFGPPPPKSLLQTAGMKLILSVGFLRTGQKVGWLSVYQCSRRTKTHLGGVPVIVCGLSGTPMNRSKKPVKTPERGLDFINNVLLPRRVTSSKKIGL